MIVDKLNYLNSNFSYYVGDIYEYDIKQAYPSILKNSDFKFRDNKLYRDIIDDNYISNNKLEILIRIGIEIKCNLEIGIYLNKKLRELLTKFQENNSLNEEDIISIKKDAIFTIKKCNNLVIDDINFRVKNRYNLYFYDYLSKFEYYILNNRNNFSYSIKGLGKNFDNKLYNQMVKTIYLTINNNDLNIIKNIQKLFFNSDYKCINYCPEFINYKNFLLVKLEDLEEEYYKNINFKEIYFMYYYNPFKVLINYLL